MSRKYEYRRCLPHYQGDFKIIFATFVTYGRWRLPESARSIVMDVCLFGDGQRFRLNGLVVMPDHVHLALTPMSDAEGPFSLMDIMQAIKSTSAHRINKLLNRKGKVWLDESYDRVLRNEENVQQKIEYMMLNPVRAGLVHHPLDYQWLWREQDRIQTAQS